MAARSRLMRTEVSTLEPLIHGLACSDFRRPDLPLPELVKHAQLFPRTACMSSSVTSPYAHAHLSETTPRTPAARNRIATFSKAAQNNVLRGSRFWRDVPPHRSISGIRWLL